VKEMLMSVVVVVVELVVIRGEGRPSEQKES
jgi:hypothetical protein